MVGDSSFRREVPKTRRVTCSVAPSERIVLEEGGVVIVDRSSSKKLSISNYSHRVRVKCVSFRCQSLHFLDLNLPSED